MPQINAKGIDAQPNTEIRAAKRIRPATPADDPKTGPIRRESGPKLDRDAEQVAYAALP